MRLVLAFLLAFYLLTSAATTYAECAWVVWQHVDWIQRPPSPSPNSRWGIGEITGSRDECEKKLEESVQKEMVPGDPAYLTTVDRRPGLSTVVRSVHKERGSEIVTSYRCLPDTMDPRGQKGGGR